MNKSLFLTLSFIFSLFSHPCGWSLHGDKTSLDAVQVKAERSTKH